MLTHTPTYQSPVVHPIEYAHSFVVLCFVVVISVSQHAHSIYPYPPQLHLLHKSHIASDKYPAIYNFVTEICIQLNISVTKWCIVGYGAGELWHLWIRLVNLLMSTVASMLLLELIQCNWGEWVIKFNSLSGDSRQRGPYKQCTRSLYIGIIIFPHIDNTQYTGHN